MAQYIYGTVSPGAAGYASEQLDGSPIANLSAIETAGTAATIILRGPDGDSTLTLTANGQTLRFKKAVTQVLINGNGSKVTFDLSGPEEYTPPTYLSVVGTSNVTVVSQTAGLALDATVAGVTAGVGVGTAFQESLWVNFPSGVPKAMNGGILTGSV